MLFGCAAAIRLLFLYERCIIYIFAFTSDWIIGSCQQNQPAYSMIAAVSPMVCLCEMIGQQPPLVILRFPAIGLFVFNKISGDKLKNLP